MWVSDQRKAHSGKKPIKTEYIELLEQIPGWKWSKPVEVSPVSSFNAAADDLAAYVNEHGKLPNPENMNKRAKTLATWIVETRSKNLKNQLSEE